MVGKSLFSLPFPVVCKLQGRSPGKIQFSPYCQNDKLLSHHVKSLSESVRLPANRRFKFELGNQLHIFILRERQNELS